MTGRVIDWRYRPFAEGWEDLDPDIVLWVDVAALDHAWQATRQHILPGGSNGQGDRYAKVREWFAANDHSDMLVANMCDDGLHFTDGRHRFAWLRDQGVTAIPLQVSPCEEAELQALFGTTLRTSELPLR